MAVIPRVEIRDLSFNILEVLDREVMSLSWEYSRIGGCGRFSFDLPRNYCEERYISGDFNVRIYIWNVINKEFDLWYQGLVESKSPNVVGDRETIQVSGHGYSAQLARIQIDSDYSSTEAKEIVKDILDNDITANTDITYDAGDLVATSFTPDTLEFNTDAKSAIETVSDIVGTREWGVDKDRKFFFKERSSSVGFTYVLGCPEVSLFNVDYDFKAIVNRVIIQGGETGGSTYTKTYNDTNSQEKYNRRDKVIQNSSIVSDTVSSQYADAIFSEFSDVSRRGRVELVNYDSRVESTVPIPLIQIRGKNVTYDTRYYNTFLYSDFINYQVNRINYSIDDVGGMRVRCDIGQLRPSLAAMIGQLEHKIEQQRAYGL